MASHRTFSGQIDHLSGQIKFGQTNLPYIINGKFTKLTKEKVNVRTIYSPYHKHCIHGDHLISAATVPETWLLTGKIQLLTYLSVCLPKSLLGKILNRNQRCKYFIHFWSNHKHVSMTVQCICVSEERQLSVHTYIWFIVQVWGSYHRGLWEQMEYECHVEISWRRRQRCCK